MLRPAFSNIIKPMAQTISNIKKSRGRPRVDATAIGLRLPPDKLAQLDGWIAQQGGRKLTRPEAIRRLIEAGLAAKPAVPSSSSAPGSTRKPAAGKTAAPRAKKRTASDRQASPPQTKEAQIRALREQGA